MENYDSNSCNTLERLYYRPIEAALRWCNLISHETQILDTMGAELLPLTGAFPQWPCLRLNTEKIWSAIHDGELAYGRDGKTVTQGETVRKDRMTVKHTDLRIWMQKTYPDQKPKFLFDEIERSTHPAINADAFRALQADRDALKVRIDKAEEWAKATVAEKSALRAERDSLRAMVGRQESPGPRSETTYLNMIGAMLAMLLNPRPGRDSSAAIIRELVSNYGDKPGISKASLENKFAEAVRSLQADVGAYPS